LKKEKKKKRKKGKKRTLFEGSSKLIPLMLTHITKFSGILGSKVC